eukprot:820964-Pleurochrysis_carterae.AAC.1
MPAGTDASATDAGREESEGDVDVGAHELRTEQHAPDQQLLAVGTRVRLDEPVAGECSTRIIFLAVGDR